MSVQFITTEEGRRLVVIPEAEYLALVEALEDREDAAALNQVMSRIERGEEEVIPAEFVDRIIDGENKIRVWREYRGLSIKALAEAAGITPAYLSQIETGVQGKTVATYQKLAVALRLTIDDIA